MREKSFWLLVKTNCVYGLHYTAYITCGGYDYSESSTLHEGRGVAKQKLFDKLKGLGHLIEDTLPVTFPPPVPTNIK